MNKLPLIITFLAVAICTCHGILDHSSIKSAVSMVSTDVDPISIDVATPRDSEAAETIDVYTGNIIIYIGVCRNFTGRGIMK